MKVFRQTDARFPMLWESAEQPPGRWHGPGEGPAHYFADTPDGAWAELLRHEEITDLADLATIRRRMWVAEIDDTAAEAVLLPTRLSTGGLDTYPPCQDEARRLRARGITRLQAPSAALKPGAAGGVMVRDGTRPAPARDGLVIVVFGDTASITGWIAADGHPPPELLDRVRYFGGR